MHKKINQTYQMHQQLQHGYLPLFPEHHGSHFIYAGLATLALIGGMGSTPIILAETLVLEQTESVMKDRAVDDKTTDATSAITTPDELPKTELPSATAEATTTPAKNETAPKESSATATTTKEPNATVDKAPDTATTTSKSDTSKTEANNSSAEKMVADKPDTAKTDATQTTESTTPTVAEPQTSKKTKNTRAADEAQFTVTFYYSATNAVLGTKTFTGDVDQVFNADPSNFTGADYSFLSGYVLRRAERYFHSLGEGGVSPEPPGEGEAGWRRAITARGYIEGFNPVNTTIKYGDIAGYPINYYYAKSGSVQYRYVDQNGEPIVNRQPGLITGFDDDGYSQIPAPPINGYSAGVLTTGNDDGVIIGNTTKVITYRYVQEGSVQYRYVDQNNQPIPDVQIAPIAGNVETGYTPVAAPSIPGYLPPQLTSANDNGIIEGGTTKTITYQYMQASEPFRIQYVDLHETEISAPLNHLGGLPVTDTFTITGPENPELENYDFQKLQRQGWNGNWIDVATELPFQDNLGDLGGFNYRLVYARMNSMTQMYVDENGAPINLDNVTEVDESGDAHWTTIGDEGNEYTAHGAIEIPGYVYEKIADDSDAETGTYDAASQKIVKYQYKTIAKAGTLYRVDTEGTVINTETFGDGPNNSTSFITDTLALTAPEIAGFQYNNEIWYTDDLPNANASWHVYDGDLASLPTTLGANNGRSYKFVYAAATTVIHKYVNQDGDEITMGTDNVAPEHFFQVGFVGYPYIVHDAPVIAGYGDPTLKSVDLPNTMTANQLEIVYEYRTNAQPITIYRVDTDDNDLGTETLTGHYTDEDLDLTPKQFAGYDFQNLFGSAIDENESVVRMIIPDLNWQAADALAYTTLKHGANHGRHYKFVYAKHVATPGTEPNNTPNGGNPGTDNNQPQPKPVVTTPTPDKPTPQPGKVPGDGTLPGTGDTSGNNSPTPGTQNNPNIVVNPLNTPVINQNTAPNNSAELPKSGSTRNYWLPILGSTLIATLLGLSVFNKKRKR